ncbi:MAG: hypothetical protein KDJ52_35360, partial [Anaerolineae bacterium]|nr:hypothetical protein [Anaerolineae bacterium]
SMSSIKRAVKSSSFEAKASSSLTWSENSGCFRLQIPIGYSDDGLSSSLLPSKSVFVTDHVVNV